MVSENKMILSYVRFFVNPGEGEEILDTNKEGIALSKKKAVSKLGLVFKLCGDRISYFDNPDPQHNNFTFTFEPWICEVFFENSEFELKGGNLYGPHPLLQSKIYIYVGSKEVNKH